MSKRTGGIVQRVFGTLVGKATARSGNVNKAALRESKKGVVDIATRWTDERPHPSNMTRYEDLNKDSEVSTAITMLSGMVAGVGYHLEMPEGDETPEDETHASIETIDAHAEAFNFDEKFKAIVRQYYEKGFCPVEKLKNGDLKILPSESFFIWRSPTGEVLKYTQKVGNSIVATWDEDMDDIILFVREESPTRPYGKALVEDVADRVDMRRQMAKDVPEVIHKYGYPFRVWISANDEIGDTVFTQATERNVDEDVFLENVLPDQLEIHTETFAHRVDFTPYVTHNDEMIAEGLMAPLMLWLRNSTEASAKVQMEAVERRIEDDQRYFARRFEQFIYTPLVGEPTPRHIWGPSETGLEDMDLEGIANLYSSGAITFGQAQTLIKELGVPIGEPVDQPEIPTFDLPVTPMAPMQDQELYVFEANYRSGRITLTEALEGGKKIIKTCVELHKKKVLRDLETTLGYRIEPLSEDTENHFKMMEFELFDTFKKKLLNAGIKR